MKSKRRYLWNALLLTAVTLLMRTVSVGFNVYISNRVGAEAMGLLSLVGSVYGFAVTLATSGIHLATVRTVATHLERTQNGDTGRVLRACIRYALCFGSLATALLLLLSRSISLGILRDARTLTALRMLALTLLPIALTSVLNGYFTAVRRAWKNALAQVSEQALKITLTCYLLVAVAPKSIEGSMLAILLGGAVSESFSLVLNTALYLYDKHRHRAKSSACTSERPRVAAIALPVAVSAYARSGLLAIEHILIPRGLLTYGAGNAAALAAYGTLHGMALPVVLYPAAILSSFSALLIPEITEQESAGNRTEIRYIAGRAYQLTLLFSLGVSGIMLLFSGALGQALYGSGEAASYIRLLAPLIPIMYLDTATDALLKGLGQQVYSMNVNIIDALISVICVALLVPRMGIAGYLVTIYVTEIFNATLSMARLLRVSGFRPRIGKLLLRPLLAVAGAVAVARIVFVFCPTLTDAALAIRIAAVSLLYALLVFLLGGFGKKDTDWLLSSLMGRG